MHYLVANSEDRFSHNEPHSKLVPTADLSDIKSSVSHFIIFLTIHTYMSAHLLFGFIKQVGEKR